MITLHNPARPFLLLPTQLLWSFLLNISLDREQFPKLMIFFIVWHQMLKAWMNFHTYTIKEYLRFMYFDWTDHSTYWSKNSYLKNLFTFFSWLFLFPRVSLSSSPMLESCPSDLNIERNVHLRRKTLEILKSELFLSLTLAQLWFKIGRIYWISEIQRICIFLSTYCILVHIVYVC